MGILIEYGVRLGLYWGCIGIMEKKIKSTIIGLYRVLAAILLLYVNMHPDTDGSRVFLCKKYFDN